MAASKPWQGLPTHLTLEQFEEFVLPHLHTGSRGSQLSSITINVTDLRYLSRSSERLGSFSFKALFDSKHVQPMLSESMSILLNHCG
ncbi:hypothetical protein [Stenomitos frigidus]|uniref:Uncharacterized protein n=1 Tax=Stenomitos frigidus ULC18 TaxID=2107698 RepID=A0A2T1EQ73_9CYAN|nr:hypothetical protein [Stenomitos frigidus]PSB34886.1 hypothetical protein C7B82_01570 [Stenomitos frigidus ULC18]